MRVIFVCNQNQNMSKTAEKVFKGRFDTISAGLYNALPLTERQVSWAGVIVVMEDSHRSEIARRFPNLHKQIISIGIPDVYHYDGPDLVKLLESKFSSANL